MDKVTRCLRWLAATKTDRHKRWILIGVIMFSVGLAIEFVFYGKMGMVGTYRYWSKIYNPSFNRQYWDDLYIYYQHIGFWGTGIKIASFPFLCHECNQKERAKKLEKCVSI